MDKTNEIEKKTDEKLESLFNRSELKRLERALKDKNRKSLAEWAGQFEMTISSRYEKHYEKYFEEQLSDMIDTIFLTIIYVLHFNECTKFGNKRIADFMNDLIATVDNFNNGSYDINDYRQQLADDGINVIKKERK